ncbi:MAG: LysR family transcriptional regulator [Eubacteriales bacterium]|nr:LysR family transcriptional regulator [Eubacteriales bacterium]
MIDIYMLEQLKTFAECGTLSAAADILNTSQPSLTRSMKRMEDELGVVLFTRSKNHLGLTQTGKMAAQYAAQLLSVTQDFEGRVRAYDRSLHTISVGYCAPVPQSVLTPIINNTFAGMTISADMTDDSDFLNKLKNGTYQLAVTHFEPDKSVFYSKKIGHEQLYISLTPGNPLSFYPEIHLKDLNGLTILLLNRIGFWSAVHREKTPNTKYLLQVEDDSFREIASNSQYPVFSSSYFVNRGETFPDRINIPIVDKECSTDFYLVCMLSEKPKYDELIKHVNENTIR